MACPVCNVSLSLASPLRPGERPCPGGCGNPVDDFGNMQHNYGNMQHDYGNMLPRAAPEPLFWQAPQQHQEQQPLPRAAPDPFPGLLPMPLARPERQRQRPRAEAEAQAAEAEARAAEAEARAARQRAAEWAKRNEEQHRAVARREAQTRAAARAQQQAQAELDRRQQALAEADERVRQREQEVQERAAAVPAPPPPDAAAAAHLPAGVQLVRWADIVAGTDNFAEDARIGTGASSEVFRCMLPALGEGPVAAKIMTAWRNQSDADFRAAYEREVGVLGALRHPRLVRLVGASSCPAEGKLALVFPLCAGGSLREHTGDFERLTPAARLHIACDVGQGLLFMHSRADAVAHRDVKSANVGLDEVCSRAFVLDLGTAHELAGRDEHTVFQPTLTHGGLIGTPGYLSPEVRAGRYGLKSDVFAFGVILMELLTGLPPVVEDEDGGGALELYVLWRDDAHARYRRDAEQRGWSAAVARELHDLATRCTATKAANRPGLRDVVVRLMRLLPPEPSADAAQTIEALLEEVMQPADGAAGGGVVTCEICYNEFPAGDVACCVDGHAACAECLVGFFTAPAGNNDPWTEGYRIKCLSCAQSLHPATVLRLFGDAAPLLMNQLLERAQEQRNELEVERYRGEQMRHVADLERGPVLDLDLGPVVHREPAQARLLDEDSMHRAGQQLAEAMTLACPHCNVAFADFNGCVALTHDVNPRCGRHFCGLCLEPTDSDRAAHFHAAQEHGNVYHSEVEIARQQKELVLVPRVRRWLHRFPPEVQEQLLNDADMQQRMAPVRREDL